VAMDIIKDRAKSKLEKTQKKETVVELLE